MGRSSGPIQQTSQSEARSTRAGYTGELTVHFHKPVPIGKLLEFSAQIASREGRRLHVTAECHVDDELVASAE